MRWILTGILLMAPSSVFADDGAMTVLQGEVARLQAELDKSVRDAGVSADKCDKQRKRFEAAYGNAVMHNLEFDHLTTRLVEPLEEAGDLAERIDSVVSRIAYDEREMIRSAAQAAQAGIHYQAQVARVSQFERELCLAENQMARLALDPSAMRSCDSSSGLAVPPPLSGVEAELALSFPWPQEFDSCPRR